MRPSNIIFLAAATAIAAQTSAGSSSWRVIDATTRQGVPNAIVTTGNAVTRTNERGEFRYPDGAAGPIHVRAHGYGRAVVLTTRPEPLTDVALPPIRPKALYLSVFGIGSRTLREAALDLIEATELNAVVIDVKGDRGLIPYPSGNPLAAAIGAQQTMTIPSLAELVGGLRERGIYTIARIVAFKDDLLASARPDLAFHRRDGSLYRDHEGLAWANPNSPAVRAYNIMIAREAAQAGFDEIQFDYARLPDATGLDYGVDDTRSNRVTAITRFLREAREALTPFNVFLAVDVFGYVCWNVDDTGIGQQLGAIVGEVDYVSPMLYPSSFQYGIPGYRNPMQHPYAIVRKSLERAVARTQLPPSRFRPWLQAFPDYAFGGRPLTAADIRAQIDAADETGASGWMLWNPRNRYSTAGLHDDDPVDQSRAGVKAVPGTCGLAAP